MTTTTDRRSGRGGTSPSPASVLAGRRVDDRGLRTRPRRTRLVAGAVLLLVLSAIGGAYLVTAAGEGSSVLTVRDGIARGQVIEREDLVSREVSGIDGTIATADASSVIGQTAAVDLVAGQVLTEKMLTSSSLPGEGEATVGLALEARQMPAEGLTAGDYVDIIAVPAGDGSGDPEPRVLASSALVFGATGVATEGGTVAVTVVVEAGEAPAISAASAAKRIAIVEVPAPARDR